MVTALIVGGIGGLIAGGVTTTVVLVGAGAGAVALATGVEEEVQDFIVGEVIEPVANAIGDTIDYIMDNPIEAVVTLGTTIFAPYAAPLLGTTTAALTSAATWAIPLANGAQTLVDGGSFEDALQDAALSYVAQSVGGTIGDFSSNQATRLITNTLGDTAVTNTVASVIGAGSKAASTAIVYGQNPVEAFKNGSITAAVGATLGYIDNQITEITGGQTGFEDLQDGIKNTIYSGIAAEVAGTDFSALDAITALDSDGYVSKVIDKYSNLGTWMSDFAKANTNLTDTELTLIGDAVGRAATVALNGNPELSGEAFFASLQEPSYEELKDLINDPLENALDNISGTWNDTVAATSAYNEKLTEAEGYATTINTANARVEEILGGQNDLIEQYNAALGVFNSNKTQANADAVDALVKKIETYVTNNQDELNTLSERINNTRPLYDAAVAELPALEAEYNKQSGLLITDVEDFAGEVTPVMQGAEKTAALALSGGIDADAYAKINSIEADEVYAHYLSRGQNLPTQERFLENSLDGMRQKALADALSAAGYSELDLLTANNGAYEAALGVFEDNLNTFVDFTSADYEDLVDRAIAAANEVSGDEIKSYSLANGVTGADVASGAASLVTIDGELQYALADQVAEAFGGKVVTTTSDSQFSNNPNTMRIEVTTYQATGDGTYRNTDTGEVVDNATSAVDDGQPAVTLPRMITNALNTDTFGAGLTKQVLDLGSSAGNVLDNTVDAPVYDTSLNLYRLMMGSDYGISGGITATGNETYDNIGAVISKGGADMLNAINGLAVLTLDADPDGPLVDKANRMLALSNSLMSDDFRGAVNDMDFIMANSGEGWKGAAQGIFGAFSAYPAQFLGYYVGSELVQEVPLMLAAAVAGSAATGAAAAAVTTQWARRIGAAAGIGTDIALNAAEAAGATAQSSYEEAYSVAMGTGKYTEDQAKEYALGIAENAAGIALYAAAVTGGWGSELSQKYFKSNEAKDAFQALTQKINDGTEVFVKEGQAESIEEALPQLYTATELVQLDPTIDVSKQVTGAALMGGIIGSTVSGTIYSGNAIADTLYNLNRDVRDAVDSSTSVQDLQTKLGALGIDDASVQGGIANYKYDGDFSTINEVKAGFEAANPDFDYSDVDLDAYLNTKDADLATAVASYVDPRFLDVDEVKAAAAAEGIELTDEQAQAYVGQKDEVDAAAEVAAKYDPQYTSRSEAIEMLRDLGFNTRGPHKGIFGPFKNIDWRTNLADQFKGKTEAEARADIESYVDPRMVTEDEARAMLEAEGYTPTQAEVDALVGQDYDDNYQSGIEAEVPDYVNPRQVTEAEARAFFADQGYDPTDEEVAALVGQGDSNFETDTAADVPAYVNPRQVTEAEARAALEAEGYTPTDAEVAEYTGQGGANFQATQEQAATSYADPRTMSEAEARALFEAQGYEPTDAEVAELVGQGGENYESNTGAGIPVYVDPRQTTEAEARAMFAAQGYDPTDEEVAAYIGQGDENFQSNKETAVGNYVDPRQTTTAEVKKAFSDAGYTATDEQVEQFVGQLNEAQQLAAVGDYIDPRQVTESEVKKFFEDLGYEATADEIAANVGQSLEATYQDTVGTDVGAYVNPRQVTEAEAKAYFDSIGYEANAAEIASFTGQGGDTFATDQETAVGAYVDPRQMTEAEVRAMFAAQGYNPTDDEVAEYIGQGGRNFEVNTSTNVTNYADPRATTEAEVRAAFEATGYQPSDEEVAARVGQGNADFESAANTEIPTYADPRLVTEAEARAFFDGLGYEATDQEVADFMGQVEDATNSQYQTQQENKVGQYVDPRQVTMDELQEIADAENLTLTEALAEAYLGQGDSNFESTNLTDARAEYDPLATTSDEARSFFDSLGYTYTDDEITQFANDSVSEAEQQTAVGSYVDPRQFTFDEAKQYMIDQGYVDPTDDEVNAFVGQGDDTFQNLGQDSAYKYVDDFTVTADEVREMYAARGLQRPTDEDIQRFVGQYEEATLEDQIIEYMPIATSNSINGIVEGLEDKIGSIATGDEPATGLYGYIDEAIQELKDAGLDVEAVEGVINDVVGTPATDDADATGIYAALEDVVSDVDSVIGRPATEDSEATGIYSAIDSAVAGVSEDVAGVAEDVTNLSEIIGTPAIEDDLATTDVDESQPATGLMGDIADLEAAGNTRDEAIAKLSEDLGVAYEDLAGAIGTPAVADDPNTVDVDESQPATGVYAALGDIETGLAEDIAGVAGDVAGVAGDVADVAAILGKPAVLDDPNTEINESQDPTGIFATIDAYEKAGIERDEALELAIGEVASALGTTETNILAELGVTKTDILGELETGLGALEESLGGDIDAIASIIGKPAQEVTQVDIDFVADVIAQSQVLDELQTAQYDVTGDGIVDINDQNLLTSALQGEDVTFADTSMFGPATGIYGTISDVQQDLQSNLDTQTETITDILTDITTQIQTGQDQQKAANMLQMLSQPGMLQQDVSVKMPDPLQLRYTYDISGPSIFATPGQAQMFVSPFGGSRATPANMTAVPQALGPSTAMTGMMPRAAGFAEGGIVDETDALLALLGDMD